MHRNKNCRRMFVPSALVVLLCLLLLSCGGKRKEEEDVYAKETKMPMEQVANREARKVFLSWMQAFSDNPKVKESFVHLTPHSTTVLARKYSITNADQFAQWFQSMRSSDTPPASFTISRIDLYDVYTTETIATITAAFRLRIGDNTTDEIGTFFLRKVHGEWRVPFAESTDLQSGWWERQMSMESGSVAEGLTTYRSEELGMQLQYPQTWDLAPPAPLAIPKISQMLRGVELSFTSENESTPNVFIRIARVSMEALSHAIAHDTTALGGFILRSTEYLDAPSEHASGKLFVLEDPDAQKYFVIFAGVRMDSEPYKSYHLVIERIVHSIKKIHS